MILRTKACARGCQPAHPNDWQVLAITNINPSYGGCFSVSSESLIDANVVPETGVTIITSMWVPPWDRIVERGWWALAAHGKKSLNLLEQTVSGNVHVKVCQGGLRKRRGMWEAHIAIHTYQMPNVVGNRNVKDAVKEGSGGGLGAVVMDGCSGHGWMWWSWMEVCC